MSHLVGLVCLEMDQDPPFQAGTVRLSGLHLSSNNRVYSIWTNQTKCANQPGFVCVKAPKSISKERGAHFSMWLFSPFSITSLCFFLHLIQSCLSLSLALLLYLSITTLSLPRFPRSSGMSVNVCTDKVSIVTRKHIYAGCNWTCLRVCVSLSAFSTTCICWKAIIWATWKRWAVLDETDPHTHHRTSVIGLRGIWLNNNKPLFHMGQHERKCGQRAASSYLENSLLKLNWTNGRIF